MAEETQQRIATQESDGSWRWQPTSAKTATLGTAGEAVLGTCAESALLLLKHARITGNKRSREAGLQALKFIQQFSVPRGAQMWECPMYQPDVLAAAHAIGAYVEAYELTTNKEYLKRATYWAGNSVAIPLPLAFFQTGPVCSSPQFLFLGQASTHIRGSVFPFNGTD